jgi:hypothetical protein
MLAGIIVVLVAAAVIGGIIVVGDPGGDGTQAAAPAAEPTSATPELVIAIATANVRAEPDRFADVIAVLPTGRSVRLLGRSSDSSWIRVAYPPESDVEGWVPMATISPAANALAFLPVLVTLATATPSAANGNPETEPLPDLIIADAFLLQDGRLTIALRNIGEASIVEAFVPLHVSKASGEILGVLRIGPTTLAPGASATVLTPVVISETGNYILELDRLDEVRESDEFNNTFTTLLIASGG